MILDCAFGPIADPAGLAAKLSAQAGSSATAFSSTSRTT